MSKSSHKSSSKAGSSSTAAAAAAAAPLASSITSPTIASQSPAAALSSSSSSSAASSAHVSQRTTPLPGHHVGGSSIALPTGLLSKEEQKNFAAKFRQAQKSPQLVELQIKALDQMISFLKQKRATAHSEIDRARQELKDIEFEEAKLHMKLDPLVRNMADKQKKKEELMKIREESNTYMKQILDTATQQVKTTNKAIASFKSKQLKQELALMKGYPMKS